MKARIMVIDEAVEKKIAEMKAYAEANRLSLDFLMNLDPSGPDVPGDNPNRCLNIRDGWLVVYSIECQPDPINWCHHISISVTPRDQERPYPAKEGVEQILRLFGLPTIKESIAAYREDCPAPLGPAINLLFRVAGQQELPELPKRAVEVKNPVDNPSLN